ncbi:ATP-grasp domain-containing protein [Alkalicoccus daliensis]|uniref:Carbamoyl-phosphate synthase large subunit n=1 Tax=Alkalicoccus daliensis TaxID=745820 RepID=A0A1H0FNS5_9BACI|nr:ATP-grasp domain-containing protein [Alkalicoccus daliensis]SDN96244.1 carbamoyl-phosphate synthase large subunit [Alkalicoccus daliensis]
MNILLTSTARRNDFIQFFQEAYEKLGISGQIIVCDPEYNAPSLQMGDISYVTPHYSDPGYVQALLNICEKHNVQGVFPLNDLEVCSLAQQKPNFEKRGIQVFVTDPVTINKIRDKGNYEEMMGALGISVPRTFTSLPAAEKALRNGEVQFPLILKPRNGSASVGIEYANTMEELKYAYLHVVEKISFAAISTITKVKPEKNVLIQQVVDGDKYSVDIFNDLEGRYLTHFIRKQLMMRGGDVDRCITCDHKKLGEMAELIGERLGHVGYLNMDVYDDGKNYYVIDINPRIGGGYSFSHKAGADIPAAVLALLAEKPVKKEWLQQQNGIEYARHDEVTTINTTRAAKLMITESAQ